MGFITVTFYFLSITSFSDLPCLFETTEHAISLYFFFPWHFCSTNWFHAAGQRVIGEPVASGLALDESWLWHPDFETAAKLVPSLVSLFFCCYSFIVFSFKNISRVHSHVSGMSWVPLLGNEDMIRPFKLPFQQEFCRFHYDLGLGSIIIKGLSLRK